MTGWGGPEPIDAVRNLTAYATPTPRGPIDLDLSTNEGSIPPPSVLEALAALEPEDLRRYPDLGGLTGAVAAHVGVDPERVLVTAGGDQAIDLVARAFLGDGRCLLTHEPSFVMIERAARFTGAEVTAVEWMGDPFPVDAFIDAHGRDTPLAVVVSPNNPTGATITADALEQVIEALAPALVVVDHAYVEFAATDLTATALEHDNAAVIRTFSKAFGLAGCRVGYLLGAPQLVDYLERIRGPYPLASPAITAATARLADGADIQGFVTAVCDHREHLEHRLGELGAEAYPSEGNFVLGRFPDARWGFDGLAGLGIKTRPFPGQPALADHLRISVPGTAADLDRLDRALGAVLDPEVVLLDMDGVIADVRESYRQAIIETAAAFGVEVSHRAIEHRKQAGDANDDWELTHGLLLDAGVDADFEAVKGTFEARYLGEGGNPPLYAAERLIDGDHLEALAARRPLGIVTGRPRRDAERFLTDHGIDGLFDAMVCKEDAPAKPDPTPVHTALETLGATRAWLVGDTPDDIRAARRAGVVPLGVVAPGEASEPTEVALLDAGAARVVEGIGAVVSLVEDATIEATR